MIIYFDTETTGLKPGQICQLCCIVEDKNGTRGLNYYFSVDYVEPSASCVTGLTVPILEKLSKGEVFGDHALEIADLFAEADLVIAHNISFDRSFMRCELERAGFAYSPKEELCSMRYFVNKLQIPGRSRAYKMPSLAELATYMGVSGEDADRLSTQIFGGSLGAHDARHDTVKMYMALQKAREIYPQFEKLILENL